MKGHLGRIAALALLYFAAGALGKLVAAPPGYVSAVWPASGLALAAVLIEGPVVLPGIFLGSLAGNTYTAHGLSVAWSMQPLAAMIAIAGGATLQAAVGAMAVQRGGFRPSLDRVEDVFRLITYGGIAATLINACVGTVAMRAIGAAGPSDMPGVWFTWWLGDAMGVILVAPFLLALWTRRERPSFERVSELIGWAAMLLALALFEKVALPLSFLTVPMLIWATLRFGTRGAIGAVLAIAVEQYALALEGVGPWVRPTAHESLILVDGVLAAIALPTLVLIASLAERRQVADDLARNAALLHSVVENIPATVFVKTADDLRYVLFNRAGEQLVGRPREAFLGKRDDDVFSPTLAATFGDQDRQVLAGGALIDIPDEAVETAGGPRSMHTRKVPIPGPDGRPRYLLGISDDITEIKAARAEIGALNAELARRVIELEDTMDELAAFAYSVSHDLRAPVRTITGFGQALRDDYRDGLDARGQRYLDHVCEGAGRLGRLLDDMLALARVTSREMHLGPVDLTALAHEVVAELAHQDPARRVAWTIEPGLSAQGDEGLLRIALANLLGNAWKFTSGRAEAHVALRRVPGAPQPTFAVQDDGAGFEPAYADKLFKPFSRLHTEEEFEGTGIGLATVARVMRRHGGWVQAEGAPDRGATFTFSLPEIAA